MLVGVMIGGSRVQVFVAVCGKCGVKLDDSQELCPICHTDWYVFLRCKGERHGRNDKSDKDECSGHNR